MAMDLDQDPAVLEITRALYQHDWRTWLYIQIYVAPSHYMRIHNNLIEQHPALLQQHLALYDHMHVALGSTCIPWFNVHGNVSMRSI